jgi:hypothetical protein
MFSEENDVLYINESAWLRQNIDIFDLNLTPMAAHNFDPTGLSQIQLAKHMAKLKKVIGGITSFFERDKTSPTARYGEASVILRALFKNTELAKYFKRPTNVRPYAILGRFDRVWKILIIRYRNHCTALLERIESVYRSCASLKAQARTDEMRERGQVVVTCECGARVTYKNLAKHKRTKSHLNNVA